jgi:hypothetical protein
MLFLLQTAHKIERLLTMTTSVKQKAKIAAWAVVVTAIATAPMTASASVSQTANTTINATVNPVISITTASPVALSLTPTGSGVVTSGSDTVTVNTNNTLGYNLTVADNDATTTLVSGANTFTASTGTKTTPVALTNGTWGFAVATGTTGIGTNGFDASYATETNSTTSTSKWAGMPATGSPMLLKSTSAVAANDTTTVWYAAKAAITQPTGTYTDTVTYTATTN